MGKKIGNMFVFLLCLGFLAIGIYFGIGAPALQGEPALQDAPASMEEPASIAFARDRIGPKKGNAAKRLIVPPNCPSAVGPYSPAAAAGGFLFVSGQIPIDPQTNQLVIDSFENQVRQSLENLRCVIESAGLTLNDVVKVTIYLVDMSRFADLNKIYEEYFGESKPARACVQVSALPKGVAVEIEAVAYFPNE
jgi:2-iminobutanoate/2-iminopropanoate deaminase